MEPSHQLDLLTLLGYAFVLLLQDVIVYGVLIPVFGAYIGFRLAAVLELGPYWELWTEIVMVGAIFFTSSGIKLEVGFWKKLFSNEKGYRMILYVILKLTNTNIV